MRDRARPRSASRSGKSGETPVQLVVRSRSLTFATIPARAELLSAASLLPWREQNVGEGEPRRCAGEHVEQQWLEPNDQSATPKGSRMDAAARGEIVKDERQYENISA